MTARHEASEAAGLALLEAIQRQRAGFMNADGDTIRRYAQEIEDGVLHLFQGPTAPALSAELLAGLRTALEQHACLVATAGARVERGLQSMGLDTVAIPSRRSRFAGTTPAHASTRITA